METRESVEKRIASLRAAAKRIREAAARAERNEDMYRELEEALEYERRANLLDHEDA